MRLKRSERRIVGMQSLLLNLEGLVAARRKALLHLSLDICAVFVVLLHQVKMTVLVIQ